MAKAVANQKVVKGDIDTTPEGAEWRGEMIEWGGRQRKVFVQKKEIARHVAVEDPYTKSVMLKRGAAGQPLNLPVTRREVVRVDEVEFILDDMGNGQTIKVFQFRPDPLDIERKEREARRKKFIDDLYEKAEKAGGLDALLEAVDGSDDDVAEPKRRGRRPTV